MASFGPENSIIGNSSPHNVSMNDLTWVFNVTSVLYIESNIVATNNLERVWSIPLGAIRITRPSFRKWEEMPTQWTLICSMFKGCWNNKSPWTSKPIWRKELGWFSHQIAKCHACKSHGEICWQHSPSTEKVMEKYKTNHVPGETFLDPVPCRKSALSRPWHQLGQQTVCQSNLVVLVTLCSESPISRIKELK